MDVDVTGIKDMEILAAPKEEASRVAEMRRDARKGRKHGRANSKYSSFLRGDGGAVGVGGGGLSIDGF